jgi:hypothetical protein
MEAPGTFWVYFQREALNGGVWYSISLHTKKTSTISGLDENSRNCRYQNKNDAKIHPTKIHSTKLENSYQAQNISKQKSPNIISTSNIFTEKPSKCLS